MAKALIVSLKYSPGHLSHIIAWKKALCVLNIDADVLLDNNYKAIINKNEISMYIFSKSKLQKKYDFVVIQNPSKKNRNFALFSKKHLNAKVIYIYHEPWDSLKNCIKEGFRKSVKRILVHCFQKRLLSVVDKVIVPSKYAKSAYMKNDVKYNRDVNIFPLIFDDENDDSLMGITRKVYFSYIGHATRSRGFDVFTSFIRYAIENNKDISFLIATRTNLNRMISNNIWLKESIKKEKVLIKHGTSMRNDEINRYYAMSFCVWNVYRRSTQSGVLPKAFMFGTPVIASTIGSFPENIIEGYNGFFVKDFNKYKTISKKVNEIKTRLENFSNNARKSFVEKYYYKSRIHELSRLIRSI